MWITRYESIAVYILGFLVFLTIIIDISRKEYQPLNRLILSLLGPLFKPEEQQRELTGASTLGLGLFILFIILPEEFFVASAWIMILSDTLAALMGRILPVYRFQNQKSIGGSGTFFICTLFILQYANIPLIPGFLMAIILSAVEFFWKGTLENMAIGFTAALLLLIM